MMNRLSLIGIFIFLSGCAGEKLLKPSAVLVPPPLCKEGNLTESIYENASPQELENEVSQSVKNVSDLHYFPQSLSPYVELNGKDQESLLEVQQRFESYYYTPWDYKAAPICLQEASWPIRSFTGGYGSNLMPVDPLWIKEMIDQSNFTAFSTFSRPAIALKWMNMRVYPTHKPLYKNPSLPGEGYPFDLLQNSSVGFNEPLFVSHYSLDGSWVYIFSNNASGWVPADGIALVNNQQIERIRKMKKLFIHTDRLPLYDQDKRFIAYSRIGMVLPYEGENDDTYKAMVVKNDGVLSEVLIPKTIANAGVRPLNKMDMAKIGEQMLHNTYGWGGMFEERDCSSMIRDMYTPFGIWLPRNSASQARKGEVISFNGLDNNGKLDLIKSKAVPFETIFYKKGHVLLYVGMYENNIMAMHNLWGIRTIDKSGKKGRVIVGKTVITTLKLGSEIENFDPDNMLLNTLVSMNIFTHQPSSVVLAPKAKVKKLSLNVK